MINLPKIYLAGACKKSSEYYCRKWRKDAEKEIKNRLPGVEVIDPLEGRSFQEKYDYTELVETDLHNVASSDLIIAEILLEHTYIGTAMELFHAFKNGIPIYIITHLEDDYFLNYVATKMFLSVKVAVSAAISKFEKANLKEGQLNE